MRTPSFLSDRLRQFLRGQKIATLPELKRALGTSADITVFRKLKELSYRSSYSHRGRYYTLEEIPQFDPLGLWSFREVWFSRFGNLVMTLESPGPRRTPRLLRPGIAADLACRSERCPAAVGRAASPFPSAGHRVVSVLFERRRFTPAPSASTAGSSGNPWERIRRGFPRGTQSLPCLVR